jgi:acetoin utilization protein AcuB
MMVLESEANMSKSEPTIQKFMTTDPKSIESTAKIKDAQALMTKFKIRHLPVTRQGKVVGILSDRDIKLVGSFSEIEIDEVVVADVCQNKPYIVAPDELIHEVAAEMAAKHYGSAIVVQNSRLVGIFTAVDACRTLAEILEMRYHQK